MDPLTHGLLGGCLGAASSSDFTDRRWRFVAGSIGGLLPDIDIVARFFTDMLTFLHWHRYISHSLIAVPVVGLLVAAVMQGLINKRQLPKLATLWWVASLGALSHVLLDTATGFGVVLLWPLNDTRIAWDLVSVVDPLVTVPLLLLAVIAIWGEQALAPRLAVAWVATLMAFGLFQQQRVELAVERVVASRGHVAAMQSIRPSFANQLLWRSVYLHGDTFYVDSVRAGWQVDLQAGTRVAWQPWDRLDLPSGSPQRLDALQFDGLANGFTVLDPSNPQRFGDIRFSMLPDSASPLWGIELKPEHPNASAEFYTDRSITPAQRNAFIDRLFGASAPENGRY
jgi:inner membrane protein